MRGYVEIFETPGDHRKCGNCVHFSRFTQWSGTCEVHDGETHCSDSCEKWDGE